MATDGIEGSPRGEAECLDERRKARRLHPFLCRGEAEAEGRPTGSNPANKLADEGLIGETPFLEPEHRLVASSGTWVCGFDRGVQEETANAITHLPHGHEVPAVAVKSVIEEARRVALVPTGEELLGMLVPGLREGGRDALPVEGPTAAPRDREARE